MKGIREWLKDRRKRKDRSWKIEGAFLVCHDEEGNACSIHPDDLVNVEVETVDIWVYCALVTLTLKDGDQWSFVDDSPPEHDVKAWLSQYGGYDVTPIRCHPLDVFGVPVQVKKIERPPPE